MGVTLTQEMITGAQESQKKYGIPASVTLAQIMLESGGSNKGGLSKLAYQYNNLFGIKTSKNNQYQSGSITMSNKAGTDTGTYATFKSKTDSILEHSRILTLDRYTKNITTGDYKDWTDALQKGGYAESSSYASKLNKIIESNNLTKYDSGEYSLPMNSDSSTGESSGMVSDLSFFGDITVIVFVIILLIIAIILFIGAWTNNNPVSEVKKTVKKVKKYRKGGKS